MSRRGAPTPAPPRPALPAWRRLHALAGNSFRLVLLGGLLNWRRDLRRTAPALGSITLLLVLCGTLTLAAVAGATVIGQAARQVAVLRVYLAPDAAPDAVAALKERLAADPRVGSVEEVSAEEARNRAAGRPGLSDLAGLSPANPFPASLDVQLRSVTAIGAVSAEVTGNPAVDPAYPTSYDPDAYGRLRRLAVIAGLVAAALVLLFVFVAYVMCANSMRAIALARREEYALMRLLAARRWMVRGPFVVEGLTTGAFAGALAGAAIAATWLLAMRASVATYTQVVPGVDPTSIRQVVAGVMTAGVALGTLTALLGLRRLAR